MNTMNEMRIIGFLGADPELRHTTSGKSVANLRVATTERWKDKAGAQQERTEWHRVVAWGTLGETVAKYLHKGSAVMVTGPIRSREYTDGEGAKHFTFDVIAREVLFLDRPERQPAPDAEPAPGGEDAPF